MLKLIRLLLQHTLAEINRFISVSHESIYQYVYFGVSAHAREDKDSKQIREKSK